MNDRRPTSFGLVNLQFNHRTIALILFAVVLLSFASLVLALRALASPNKPSASSGSHGGHSHAHHGSSGTHHAKSKGCGITTLSACGEVGCPGFHDSLNVAKNRTDDATGPSTMSVADVIALNSKVKPAWKVAAKVGETMPRDEIRAAGEGQPVEVEGFLVYAATQGSESCNCYLPRAANNDYHLELGATAHTPRSGAIVIEVTPRKRLTGWSFAKLDKAANQTHKHVKVTGWLMLDSAHLDGTGGARASLWEIHPVTKLELIP